VDGRHHAYFLFRHARACDLSPGLESSCHLFAVFGGREEVTPMSKVRCDRAIHGENALCVSQGLESPHAVLALVGRLVSVLGAVVQTPMLPMFHTGRISRLAAP
jgi:hypothetical protein